MSPPGVYRTIPGERPALVHAWEDDETELADVAALMDVGEVRDGGAVLLLSRHELRLLRVAADAASFDHPEPFVRMCLAIANQELPPDAGHVELVSVG